MREYTVRRKGRLLTVAEAVERNLYRDDSSTRVLQELDQLRTMFGVLVEALARNECLTRDQIIGLVGHWPVEEIK